MGNKTSKAERKLLPLCRIDGCKHKVKDSHTNICRCHYAKEEIKYQKYLASLPEPVGSDGYPIMSGSLYY